MPQFSYDSVAQFCMVASLLLFVAMFAAVIIYVFAVLCRDKLEADQRVALDLTPGQKDAGSRT